MNGPGPKIDFKRNRDRMVRDQIEARGVSDPEVLRAMRKVPRHLFVEEALIPQAYEDHPLPLGHGQTISQPYVVAWMTELLEVSRGLRVLEIGTGSGFLAACLGQLGRSVTSIERHADLAAQAQANGGTATLTTVQGEKLTVKDAGGGQWRITDAKGGTSTITQADIAQSNGVVHVVDTVLMPK